MSDAFKFFLLGLGVGGIYSLLALSVVVVYRGSGVVNFANGAFALLGAATFYELRDDAGTVAAAVAGVVVTALAGVLVQLLVMRPMRHASPLARVIATLGLLAAATEAAHHRYGDTAVFVDSVLPSRTVTIAGATVSVDRFILLGIALVLFGLLQVLYRRTRFGLATTGVAENELAMSTLGWSPDLVASINWAAGGAIAGLSGVLLVPITGLSPSSLTLTVIPALSAALVGGFASLPLTLLGGLLIGVLENEATRFISSPGWSTSASFLVILVVLVVRGKGLPLRSHLTDRLPHVGSGVASKPFTAVVALVALVTVLTGSGSWTDAVITSTIFAIVCLSLVVVTGYAGQLSLAQFSIAGIGALVATRLNDAGHVPFLWAALIGVLATVPVALLVALPSLRARGVNLAVATMGLSVVINGLVFSNPDYTGGIIRGTVVPPPKVFGFDVYVGDHPARYTVLCLLVLALLALAVSNLRRGRAGRALIAVRDNERAAASLGVSVFGAKLYAFSIAGVIAGFAGVLLAFRTPNVTFGGYDVFASINVVLLAVIGGVGYIAGAVVGGLGGSGGAVQNLLARVLDVSGWFNFGAALLLVVTVVFSPDGVVHSNLAAIAAVRRRFGKDVQSRRDRLNAGRVAALMGQAADGPQPGGAVRGVAGKPFELREISLRFGGVQALDGVSLTVAPGEVVGLIGPNGAGKTTLIDVATGFYRHNDGDVLLEGAAINSASAVRRARAGVTRSFQSLELFEDLTVAANLRAASDERGLRVWLADLVRPHRGPLNSAAAAAVREFELESCLMSAPSELPYAQRRLVAIARAVATMPSVLLLDEPAAGLDERSTRELGVLIRRLAEEWGMGILLVEHDVPMVLSTCDRIVALEFGKVIATGTPDEIRADQQVIDAYLGTATDDERTATHASEVNPT